jgi:hypothetical protein
MYYYFNQIWMHCKQSNKWNLFFYQKRIKMLAIDFKNSILILKSKFLEFLLQFEVKSVKEFRESYLKEPF